MKTGKHVCSIASAIVLMFSVNAARADLVSIGACPRSGQGSPTAPLTHDTETGLDWLDVTETTNQNYDDVRTGKWYRQGFRHATMDEVRTLFEHAGTPDDGFDVSVTFPVETRALQKLLGITHVAPQPSGVDNQQTYGLIGNDFLGNLVTLDTHPVGQTFNAALGKLDAFVVESAGLDIGEGHFTGGAPFSDEASPEWGSFLVRPHTCRRALCALREDSEEFETLARGCGRRGRD